MYRVFTWVVSLILYVEMITGLFQGRQITVFGKVTKVLKQGHHTVGLLM